MVRASIQDVGSIRFSMSLAELQTQPACYPFSSVDHYANAARHVGKLLEDGYEVPQKIIQRLETTRRRVYNPRASSEL